MYTREQLDKIELGLGGQTVDYKCYWCGLEFTQVVRKAEGRGPLNRQNGRFMDGKHKSVSSQVQCRQCHNFIPTWS